MNVFAAIVMVILLCVLGGRIAGAEEDPRKEYLRLQYTETCANPLPKSDALPKALDEAIKIDPKTWMPWVLWWNAEMEKRQKAMCGDA